MRKLQSLLIGILSIILLLTIVIFRIESDKETDSEVLTIYNWGDYIDYDLLFKFEKESGLKVIYETFDSNEAMFTKIQQGGTHYDIAVPSEYMVSKMKKEKLLYKLDCSKIVGLSNISKLFFKHSSARYNIYSIPYFWGTLGIVYNEKMIKGKAPLHWQDLWDLKYKNNIMLIDGARDVLGFGLKSLGYSINIKDESKLQKTAEKLEKITPNVKAIVADEIKMYMAQNEAAVAVTYSGEATEMIENNKHLHYIIPSEGSNYWFDDMVIPKTAKNIKGAYKFINFMLRAENAAQNAKYIGYATPNIKALKLLPKAIRKDPKIYPNEKILDNLEVYQNLGPKWLEMYNNLYLEFKMYRN
ncbi:MAG: ABC transporter substrate-binding protein [Streptococcaceae bacterium]|jgi:spermidine/putrescine transport system substrate-binding protein|nr:ABC transporter substrate-binding protein [Streptococcaceae bacterium]